MRTLWQRGVAQSLAWHPSAKWVIALKSMCRGSAVYPCRRRLTINWLPPRVGAHRQGTGEVRAVLVGRPIVFSAPSTPVWRAGFGYHCSKTAGVVPCDSPLGEMDSSPRSHFTALTVSDLPLVGSVKGPSSVDSHSLLEEAGFEPSVPPTGTAFFTEGNELYPLPINHQVGDHASSGPL
jgi:hypothetical protein